MSQYTRQFDGCDATSFLLLMLSDDFQRFSNFLGLNLVKNSGERRILFDHEILLEFQKPVPRGQIFCFGLLVFGVVVHFAKSHIHPLPFAGDICLGLAGSHCRRHHHRWGGLRWGWSLDRPLRLLERLGYRLRDRDVWCRLLGCLFSAGSNCNKEDCKQWICEFHWVKSIPHLLRMVKICGSLVLFLRHVIL